MGGMDLASLVASLKASLGAEVAALFRASSDADLERHLEQAALDMSRVRPRTKLGSVTLAADTPNYSAPADLLRLKQSLWGVGERRSRRPWASDWPGPMPTVRVAETTAGRELYLTPAPTAAQIAALGSEYQFFYFAAHAVGATAAETTIQAGDRGLLLLRAQAEAMQELAMHGVGKPVRAVPGTGGSPRNGTPAALAQQFMDLFEALAA